MEPDEGRMNRSIRESVVLFPAPEGPTTAVSPVRAVLKEMPRRAASSAPGWV
ncbi:hypothetical protein GCM10020254_78750 [Streptomyces goshikiensis]